MLFEKEKKNLTDTQNSGTAQGYFFLHIHMKGTEMARQHFIFHSRTQKGEMKGGLHQLDLFSVALD